MTDAIGRLLLAGGVTGLVCGYRRRRGRLLALAACCVRPSGSYGALARGLREGFVQGMRLAAPAHGH